MKTLVSDSSIEAYYAGKVKSDAVAKVLEYAKSHKTFTRRMISQATGISTATVSGIVTPLIYDAVSNPEGVLLETLSRMPCPITGNKVHWLEHKDNAGGQMRLC